MLSMFKCLDIVNIPPFLCFAYLIWELDASSKQQAILNYIENSIFRLIKYKRQTIRVVPGPQN